MEDNYSHLKILAFFSAQLTPEILSGGEKMFVELAKVFLSNDVNLFTVIPDISTDVLKKEIPKSNFITIPCLSIESKLDLERFSHKVFITLISIFRTLYQVSRLNNWIKKHGINIMYSVSDYFPAIVAPAFFKFFKLNSSVRWFTVIHHIIGSPLKREKSSFINSLVAYSFQKISFFIIRCFSDAIFVKNHLVKYDLMKMGFDGSTIYISDNGIDLDKIDSYSLSYDGQFDMCYVGRLSKTKGVEDLIYALELISKEIQNVKLAIIGGCSPSEENRLKTIIKSKNLERNIVLFGFLNEERVYSIRKQSKLFVSASYEEGWGISVAESLACKIPGVVYDLSVYREKFSDALLYAKIGNINDLANKTLVLLKDKTLRIEMGRNGRMYIEKYDIKNIAKRELEMFSSALLE